MANVLIVDDDPAVGGSPKRILTFGGHESTLATSGQEALNHLRRGSFGLIVTDINMEGMDGIELILVVRELAPELPLIAMSGGGLIGRDFLLEDARALGVAATLAKPYSVEEVLRVVEHTLTK